MEEGEILKLAGRKVVLIFCILSSVFCVLSTSTAAIVADNLVAAFRLDGFRCEAHTVDTPADIFRQTEVDAGTDHMTKTHVADAVGRATQTNAVE